MSKRDPFKKNVMRLTRRKSISTALSGWEVLSRIRLKTPSQSCELCSTRFARGAWVSHPRYTPQIAVGGTCLEYLLLGRLKPAGGNAERKRQARTILRREYGSFLSPGHWTRWLRENAPARLDPELVELEHLGMTKTVEGLRKLIRFHDSHRLFPIESLIPACELIRDRFRGKSMITINHARKALMSLEHTGAQEALLRKAAEESAQRFVREQVRAHDGSQRTWSRLDPLTRRAVVALYARSERRSGDEPIVPPELAAHWPELDQPRKAQFCWHPERGLAFAEELEEPYGLRGPVMLLVEQKEVKARFWSGWLDVCDAPESAVEQLERIAFGEPIALAKGLRP